ncbi:alpha/beta hydrolase [Candidatus Pacearchaeota archaeon]|nr:alpha/beta hydrolase [Candidatus Pacearchaeota archaeon]
MKIYEERSMHPVESGSVNLERCDLFSEKSNPALVFVKGLGASVANESLLHRLAQDYCVTTWSPRNNGNSTGHLAIDNLVSDTSDLVRAVSQEKGEKPFAIAHSMGGYALARVLENEATVEKAVLLSPLNSPSEQMPSIFDLYFKQCAKAGRNPFPVAQFNLGDQRFDEGDVARFLTSIYDAKGCDQTLKSPTQVFLSGATSWGLSISKKEFSRLSATWKSIGADVQDYFHLNHYFSGKRFGLTPGCFTELEKPEVYGNIMDFLKR